MIERCGGRLPGGLSVGVGDCLITSLKYTVTDLGIERVGELLRSTLFVDLLYYDIERLPQRILCRDH